MQLRAQEANPKKKASAEKPQEEAKAIGREDFDKYANFYLDQFFLSFNACVTPTPRAEFGEENEEEDQDS